MGDDGLRRNPRRAARAALAAVAVVVGGAGFCDAAAVDHGRWDRLLRRYVDAQGRVAYKDLAAEDRPTLDAYLRELAMADPEPWSPAEAKAFWINAYNAGVVAAVLAGYTAENVLKRWSLFNRFTFALAGRHRTLHAIEHEILRPAFRDPRVHFALVCASTSCPRLRRRAYTGATVDAALDEEARRFINDPTRNRIDPSTGRVRLSAIFDWFADDFHAAADSVVAFVARYVERDDARATLLASEAPFTYLPYDWTLNAQAGHRP